MSGGCYDYKCHHINDLANRLNDDLVSEKWKEYDREHIEETELALLMALDVIKRAAALGHAVEWLMGGDYGNKTFLKEFKEIMKKEYKLFHRDSV